MVLHFLALGISAEAYSPEEKDQQPTHQFPYFNPSIPYNIVEDLSEGLGQQDFQRIF